MTIFTATFSTCSHFADVLVAAETPEAAVDASRTMAGEVSLLKRLQWHAYEPELNEVDTIYIANPNGFVVAEWQHEGLESRFAVSQALRALADLVRLQAERAAEEELSSGEITWLARASAVLAQTGRNAVQAPAGG